MFCVKKYLNKRKGSIIVYVYVIGLFCSFLAFNSLMREIKFYRYNMLHNNRIKIVNSYDKNNELLLSKLNDLIDEHGGINSKKELFKLVNENEKKLRLDSKVTRYNYIDIFDNRIRVVLKYDASNLIKYVYEVDFDGTPFKYNIQNWEVNGY